MKLLFAVLALILSAAAQEDPGIIQAELQPETAVQPELTPQPQPQPQPQPKPKPKPKPEPEPEQATEPEPELEPESKNEENPPKLTLENQFTVKSTPFTIEKEISGILVPTKTQTLNLAPAQWKAFTIESIPEHGAEIKVGDPLIVFKTEEIDRALIEKEEEVKSQELKLAIANRELTELQQKNALSLAGTKRKMEHAEEDLAYFESTGQPARKESLTQSLQQAEDFLSYQKEELTQLLKMYEEDDITEETEEIILVRQKANVRNAQNILNDRKRENKHTLETAIPRELLVLQDQAEAARIDYATAKLNLERTYGLKKLEVTKLERNLEETKKALKEMEADRGLFEVLADFDGRLVYGEFAEGEWNKGKTSEFLKSGGKVPVLSSVLTLVAKDSPLALQAQLDSEKTAELQASVQESGEKAPEVEISDYLNLKGTHLVSLTPRAAEDFEVPGQSKDTNLVFYAVDSAITIPNEALQTKEDGSSYVMVKLSEGEPEERKIELGKKDDTHVEVLSGLEEGQVILY